MQPRILEVSPILPPGLNTQPSGLPVPFASIVRDAGMRNVVTSSRPLDVRLHGGTADFKVPTPGGAIYCLSGTTLPAEQQARARELLRRLAYSFKDYSAREIVARYHRDQKRAVGEAASEEQARKTKATITKSALRLRRALHKHPGATIGQLAELTGMAQPNVSRTIAALVEAGVVTTTKHSKSLVCRLASDN